MGSRIQNNANVQLEPRDVEIIDLTLSSSDDASRGSPREMSEDASVPWYEDPHGSHPFSLSAKSRTTRSQAMSFTGVEFFPWGDTPLETLWNGDAYVAEHSAEPTWLRMVSKWRNTVAICGGKVVRIVNTGPGHRGSPLFQVTLPPECQFSVIHLKWALNPWNLHPLLLYVHSSVLHVFDVESRNFLGCIRGHGGDITSLGVHPLHPHLVNTTSKDYTTRIYDLRIHAGARTSSFQNRQQLTFGMRIESDQGDCSIGRCVLVLAGGRSGGHEAAVLGADFHPSLPLVATCGMDHALRIWHLRPQLFLNNGAPPGDTDASSTREDKPLFSSTAIHDARIHSVHWLSYDLLLSHSAPPISWMNGEPATDDSGTLAVWQWLSVNRFFPPDVPIHREPPLRGCISDYRESSSYKLVSVSRLPLDASRVFVNRHRHRPPLVIIPMRSTVFLLNSSHFSPRIRPILHDRDRQGGNGDARLLKRVRLSEAKTETVRTDVEGWTLNVVLGEDLEDEEVEGCAMSPDAQQVVAVGAREGMWLWDVVH